MKSQERGLRKVRHIILAGTALAAMMPMAAQAAPAKQADLEARLKMLEQAVTSLKAELEQARTQQAAQVATQEQVAENANAIETRVAAVEARPAAPSAPADGFKVGGTTFKMGGFVKAVASATHYSNGEMAGGALGKEFYLPQQIPVGNGPSTNDVIGHARQTRLFFDTATSVGGKELKSHVEFDFALATAPAGAQRSTNAYTPTFRRGFLTYGNWLIGQEWTNFQNPVLFPESTDFIGPSEGVIFVRQMLVQYRHALGNGLSLSVAVENPQTEALASTSANGSYSDSDQDRLPDFTAKLAFKNPNAEVHVAGLVREISMRTNVGANRYSDSVTGWGVNAGGKILFGPDKRHNFMFSATYGQGIGRYLAVGYAADALYDGSTATPLAGGLKTIDNFAGFGALRLGWTPTVRSTFMGGYQHAKYPDGIVTPGLANKESWSLAGNLFWSPVKNFDVGIEYRHGERKVINGLSGQMDRVEMSAKYTF